MRHRPPRGDPRDPRDPRDPWDPRDPRDPRGTRDTRDPRDPREPRDPSFFFFNRHGPLLLLRAFVEPWRLDPRERGANPFFFWI